jgi:hypothetical protein
MISPTRAFSLPAKGSAATRSRHPSARADGSAGLSRNTEFPADAPAFAPSQAHPFPPGALPMHAVRPALLCPLLALAASASCVELTEVPVGGVYRVTLESQGGEGGAVFQLVGPGIQQIAPTPGAVAAVHAAGDTLRVMLLADPRIAATAPLAFDLTMADGAGVPDASVLQVIAPNNRRRDFASSYRVTFSR